MCSLYVFDTLNPEHPVAISLNYKRSYTMVLLLRNIRKNTKYLTNVKCTAATEIVFVFVFLYNIGPTLGH